MRVNGLLVILSFLISCVLFLLPLNMAFALGINPSAAKGKSYENTNGNLASLNPLTFEPSIAEVTFNPMFDSYYSNATMIDNGEKLYFQWGIPTSTFLDVKGFTSTLTLNSLPTFMLLLGAGLIGLIGIARRSFFTT